MIGDRRRVISRLGWLLVGMAVLLMAVSAGYGLYSSMPERTRYAAVERAEVRTEPIQRPNGTVDVNHGDLDELMLLHGIGETLGQAILDERNAHGPFFYPEDLLAVKGIGKKKLDGFREQLDLTEE